jgi:hypothetical protein
MWKTLAVVVLTATVLAPVRAQALENEELLTLVAMPLAVAAVSEITDVPVNQLMDVVTLLNDAAVPPSQFIEVVRYVPVALVVEMPGQPTFVEFLRNEEQQGVRGTALVTSIATQMQTYGLPDLDLAVTRPRTIDVVDGSFIPKRVRTRMAEAKAHPHGGPPGQLKKVAGVQTGAEIVHRDRGKRDDDASNRVVTRVVQKKDDDKPKARKFEVESHGDDHPKAHAANGHGNGGDHGKGHGGGGHGKGHGNGKGKGKG